MSLKQINEFIETTNDITMVEAIELMGEVINEHIILEDTIEQVYTRRLANINKKHLSKINNKIPGIGGIKKSLANDWRKEEIQKLNDWRKKYSSMDRKGTKNILNKIRLGYIKSKPRTKMGMAATGIGLAATGMGYAAYRAFRKDKS